jgi:hypothetical protein
MIIFLWLVFFMTDLFDGYLLILGPSNIVFCTLLNIRYIDSYFLYVCKLETENQKNSV